MRPCNVAGQIIKQEWENSKYVLQVNPFEAIKNEKPPANEQLLLKNVWEQDMQLLSKYLDEKVRQSFSPFWEKFIDYI